ncbi:MAG TPA: hypothetical protein VFV00_13510 [Acidimicrobiales bacterium]|nr:hypothetical protein [Acidimicrobiales bacterium]
MKRSRVFAPLAAAVVALPLAVGCSSDSPTAISNASSSAAPSSASSGQRASACRPVPAQGEALDWLPADLPLPPGAYAAEDTESPSGSSASSAPSDSGTDTDAESGDTGGARRGFLVVKMTVEQFKDFVTTNWPKAGYSLGRGDAEAGEAEGGFRKGDFGGVYRVRDVYCDPTMSELLLTYGKGA